MAAFNKLGSLIRHSALTSGSSAGSSPAVFNAARLMSTKLFVGGLSWGTDDQSLKEAFTSFGEVTEARVITDRESGRSRGFGFVSFNNTEDAKSAMEGMDGQELQGRSVRVNFANERPTGPRSGAVAVATAVAVTAVEVGVAAMGVAMVVATKAMEGRNPFKKSTGQLKVARLPDKANYLTPALSVLEKNT
ncbi:hypothetical protein EJB05_41039 [Eragrostis curvula]|uniref:RRM domain-containing protein n=1 Tax=Eragrostis curvula TaxID=38414 RepID=A0A5J9T8P8_9POAL|nr:hypothetical protein EJB05_41039 [Eragrostis curvula]